VDSRIQQSIRCQGKSPAREKSEKKQGRQRNIDTNGLASPGY
jgi:hypothetical protein